MAPNVDECLAHAKWLVAHGRGGEPCKLVLPRVEAQRRKANREKRTRVAWDDSEQGYIEWHTQISRYRELIGNTTIASQVMCQILAAVEDEMIKKLAEEPQP